MSSDNISTTAYTVATGIAKLSQLPRWKPYISDEVAALNRAFMQHGKTSLAKRLISWLPPALMLRVMDTIYIPGMTQHYLFRKQWIENRVNLAVSQGITQFIILGGGFDTLALRMAASYEKVQFLEIDLPDTQRAKLNILAKIHQLIPTNCHYTPADLSQATLSDVLQASPDFNAAAPTVVILEGVLMYLTETEVNALFSELHTLFKELFIIYGAIAAPDADAGNLIRMTSALLGRGSEQTKWHCSAEGMTEFMARLGYKVKESITYKTLQRGYRKEREIGQVPEQDENYYLVANVQL